VTQPEKPAAEMPPALRAELAKALAAAQALLAPHEAKLRSAWRRKLEDIGIGAEEQSALSGLMLGLERVDPGTESFEALSLALDRQGLALAGLGVPEEHALAALFARLEAFLPFVLAHPNARDLPGALVRLTWLSARAIRSGYASARRSSWRSFDERERLRLSRDLHDEIGHQLVVLKLYLELIAKDLPRGRASELRQKLAEALSLVGQALQSVRRLILDLGPAVLEEVGFLAAVRLYARQFTARTGVNVQVRDTGLDGDVPGSHATALYRVLQGALSNVLKHAEARSVTISVGSVRKSVIVLVVEDDGVGFDPLQPRQAFGLAAMRERIEGLGGRFHIESRTGAMGRKNHGTRIEIDLPYERT
jgi:signal transduction histidine kinase